MHIGTFNRIFMNRFFFRRIHTYFLSLLDNQSRETNQRHSLGKRSQRNTPVLCIQTYQLAQSVVLPKLKKDKANLAIVMDLDETVLDNSNYQVERAKTQIGVHSRILVGMGQAQGGRLGPRSKSLHKQDKSIFRPPRFHKQPDGRQSRAHSRKTLQKLGVSFPG